MAGIGVARGRVGTGKKCLGSRIKSSQIKCSRIKCNRGGGRAGGYSTNRAGDIAETAFLARATEEGLVVASPYGGGLRYDTIVDNMRRRLLVQVKSTSCLCRKNVYQVRAARQKRRGKEASRTVGYLRGEIDFLAVYVAPEKEWFILPWSALRGRTVLTLNSREHGKPGPCGEFREAWGLLRE